MAEISQELGLHKIWDHSPTCRRPLKRGDLVVSQHDDTRTYVVVTHEVGINRTLRQVAGPAPLREHEFQITRGQGSNYRRWAPGDPLPDSELDPNILGDELTITTTMFAVVQSIPGYLPDDPCWGLYPTRLTATAAAQDICDVLEVDHDGDEPLEIQHTMGGIQITDPDPINGVTRTIEVYPVTLSEVKGEYAIG